MATVMKAEGKGKGEVALRTLSFLDTKSPHDGKGYDRSSHSFSM